jgi:hypothetical protein
MVLWQGLGCRVMNLQVSYNAGNFSTNFMTVNFSLITPLHAVI